MISSWRLFCAFGIALSCASIFRTCFYVLSLSPLKYGPLNSHNLADATSLVISIQSRWLQLPKGTILLSATNNRTQILTWEQDCTLPGIVAHIYRNSTRLLTVSSSLRVSPFHNIYLTNSQNQLALRLEEKALLKRLATSNLRQTFNIMTPNGTRIGSMVKRQGLLGDTDWQISGVLRGSAYLSLTDYSAISMGLSGNMQVQITSSDKALAIIGTTLQSLIDISEGAQLTNLFANPNASKITLCQTYSILYHVVRDGLVFGTIVLVLVMIHALFSQTHALLSKRQI